MPPISTIKNKLILTTALLGALVGYGRRAYAIACGTGNAPNYVCNNSYLSSLQLTGINNAFVTTGSQFEVNTVTDNGLTISGDGAITFQDTYSSQIKALEQNSGVAALAITSTGDDGGTAGSITVNINSIINGGYYGILANNNGTGAVNIVSYGDVTGGARGIFVFNDGTDLTVFTGAGSTTTGTDEYGIYTRNGGTGATSIFANGDVYAGNFGIYARNYTNSGTDITITTGPGTEVVGTDNAGINARNEGTGFVNITAYGNVTGGTSGIYARNYDGTDISITTGAGTTITGMSQSGIFAQNFSTGNISVTVNGDVSGGTIGISANNSSGADLSIATLSGTSVTGGSSFGVYAMNTGSGSIDLDLDGAITGRNGIFARTLGTDLTITTGDTVTGTHYNGIYARNDGTGIFDISVYGDVSSVYTAISALHYGTDLTLTTGAYSTVTGDIQNGINARNFGTGKTEITVNGNVTGAERGISAETIATGTDLTIMTGAGRTVTGTAYYGIRAKHYGTGALTITTDGDVIGGTRAIYATNYGADDFTLTANGDVTGGQFGISVVNTSSADDLTVITGAGSIVSGGTYNGIWARNEGTGNLTVTAYGDAVGGWDGINLYNYLPGKDLTVTTGVDSMVEGLSQNGIVARNRGTGVLAIIVDGDVTGHSAGIYAHTYGSGLTINSGSDAVITGTNSHGISARNDGVGALSITAYGSVTGYNRGILAANYGPYATNLSVTTGVGSTIIGRNQGIAARQFGSGTLNITINGAISINANNVNYAAGVDAGGSGSGGAITLNNGSTISAFGEDSAGIYSWMSGLSITLNGDSAVLTTGDSYNNNYNDYASGIRLSWGGSNNAVTLNDTSSVTTSGEYAHGINLGINATANTVTLNGGSITVTGDGSNGINADSKYELNALNNTSYYADISNTVVVQNGSTVSGETGIFAHAHSQLDITLDGTLA